MTSVLIVDDHAAFRAAARQILSRDGFDVVGEAADAVAAMSAIEELSPDVLVLDIQLPGRDGIDLARDLADAGAGAAVVLISTRDESDYGARLRRAGAVGFVRKEKLSPGTLAAVLAGQA